jgi:hypothetical protein
MTVRVTNCAPPIVLDDEIVYVPNEFHSAVIVEVDTLDGVHTRQYARFIGPRVAVQPYRCATRQNKAAHPAPAGA